MSNYIFAGKAIINPLHGFFARAIGEFSCLNQKPPVTAAGIPLYFLCCATIYRLPRAFRRLHSDSSPQVPQHFPSGPTSINLPLWTSKQIMDMTAEGWAFMARLISERLKPFSRVSSRLTSCESICLPEPQQQSALINEEGNDPCHASLVDGRGHSP